MFSKMLAIPYLHTSNHRTNHVMMWYFQVVVVRREDGGIVVDVLYLDRY